MEKKNGGVKRVEGEGRDVNGKTKAKVLMCCSQSQLVLALPGSLASGAYWFVAAPA